MIGKGRRDFCIECRKETEYLLQKKDIVKNIGIRNTPLQSLWLSVQSAERK